MPDAAQAQQLPGSTTLPSSGAERIGRLADDNGAFRDMLVWAFDDEGCEVVAVGNGTDLRELLASSLLPCLAVKPFDVVVTEAVCHTWRIATDSINDATC